ncbi:2,3-bisphosphoglycerate-dependent phosphoglycerate mutase [Amycolatopsis sp. RTGN1]|uniref:2,3-bisphosphoglycerate-dependent phosphoglycerate mutase n=1 Tax=Amycolatopsis ponsaeliensis TaxID=2992142 RepID=UPI00254DCB67|nr:2,3-bisphosphoglycerate-dependent phosphoglycerate mutase [Amycolatopsis sp. RTGN1]
MLLRHGESVWNADDRFAGWTDVPLSEVGRKEAAGAGVSLARSGCLPDVVHTSLLRRAISTAAIALDVAGRHWIPVRRSRRLNERHYGALEGRSREEVRAQYGDEQFMTWRRSYSVAPPAGESLEDVLARLLPYWEAAVAADLRAGRTVLVVSHGNVLRTLISHFEGLPPRSITVPTGEPFGYELTEELQPAGGRRFLSTDRRTQ